LDVAGFRHGRYPMIFRCAVMGCNAKAPCG
jgi:hypothetical protein